MAWLPSSVPKRRLLRWSLFLLPPLWLAWGLYLWLPPEPRWALPDASLRVLALFADSSAAVVGNFGDQNVSNLRVIDLRTGQTLPDRFAEPRQRGDMVFTREGYRCATVLAGGKGVQLFNLRNGKTWEAALEKGEGHSYSTRLFSPDGSILVVGDYGAEPKVVLVDTDTGQFLTSLKLAHHDGKIIFTPDSSLFLYPVRDGEAVTSRTDIHAYDTRRRCWAFRLEDANVVQVSPDSRTLIASRPWAEQPWKAEYLVWDLQRLRLRQITPRNRRYQAEWAFSANSDVLACWAVEGPGVNYAEFWDLQQERELARIKIDEGMRAFSASFAPDGRRFAAWGVLDENTSRSGACVWEVNTGRLLWTRSGPCWTRSPDCYRPEFTVNSRHVLMAADAPHRLEVLNAEDGAVESTIPLRSGEGRIWDTIQGLTPDGKHYLQTEHFVDDEPPSALWEKLRAWLPVSTTDRSPSLNLLLVVDRTTGRETCRLTGRGITGPGVSPDGRTLLTCSNARNALECWDLPPGKPLGWLLGPPLALAGVLLLLGRFFGRLRSRRRPALP